jgi:hypothetical protein
MSQETISDDQKPTKLWRLKYWFNRARHRLGRILRGFATHWLVAIILPWITGSYYAILDIWGDDWSWVRDHKEAHEVAFFCCLCISLLSQFLSSVIREPHKLESDQQAREILSEFIGTVGAIVQAKIDRFRSKLSDIKPNSDKFKHITKPEDQVSVIANATARFLQSAFGFHEDQIDITILRKKDEGGWNFDFRLQQWSHTAPDVLMSKGAAAMKCLEHGEPAFYPDKIKAAGEGKFVLSGRDKRRGPGSAFIYPIGFSNGVSETQYVVSLVTYGKQFCADYDVQSCEITNAFLREVCRRFEVELCLDTIKRIQ